jgi:hypothetical protein
MEITKWSFRILGAGMAANGLWMLSSALPWFNQIPADMAATGHPNIHLIHDVGLAYFIFGMGLVWCAQNLATCRPVYLGTTFFMAGHALSHVQEILVGQLPGSHWWIDFPLVFLPGILLSVLAIPKIWQKATTSS